MLRNIKLKPIKIQNTSIPHNYQEIPENQYYERGISTIRYKNKSEFIPIKKFTHNQIPINDINSEPSS
jgi:hypothetical protein